MKDDGPRIGLEHSFELNHSARPRFSVLATATRPQYRRIPERMAEVEVKFRLRWDAQPIIFNISEEGS